MSSIIMQHNTTQHNTTIIVPVYNVEKYLPQCIDSIIHQTCHNIDIILVDDGSTDSSGNICDSYAKLDPRISVIHKPNGGISDARNAGLSQATTKYVYFLDSDDYIEPQAVEILQAVCEQNSLDLLSFDVNEIIYEADNYKEDYDYLRASGIYPDVTTGAKLYADLVTNKDYKPLVQLHFYNREFLLSNNLTFKKGIHHEDELFTFITHLHAQRAMHIPARLFNRRIRPGSVMTTKPTTRNSDSLREILQEILHKYSRFRDDPATREAYDLGVKYLSGGYVWRYLTTLGLQDSIRRTRFWDMMNELQAQGCDTSRYRRRVKFHHLYSIKSAISKIPGLKSCYHAAKRLAKRLITRLDEEAEAIIARLNETNKPGTKRIITLCVPRHSNRGDIAIALAQRKMLTENFPDHVLIEIPGDLLANYPRLITRGLNTSDVLLTHGGGYFGTLWRNDMLNELRVLRRFPNNRIIIMPQTWYYSDDKQGRRELEHDRRAFAKFTDLHVFARDRNSFDLIHRESLYPNARSIHYVPDMACSMDFLNLAPKKRSGVLVCFRPDLEQVVTNSQQNEIYAKLLREFAHVCFFSTNPAQSPVKMRDWDSALTELLTRMAGAALVVTDRLHGMLLSAVTGTPCVAFDNRTGKVRSVHEWLKGMEYVQVCGDVDDFERAMNTAMNAAHVWDNSGLLPYFAEITDAISGKE